MPKLRPIGGRHAAAAVPETEDEANLQGQVVQDVQQGDDTGGPLQEGADGQESDPSATLKAQIAALERSNKEYLARIETEQREKAEALRQAQERRAEIDRLQEQTTSSQAEAIGAALAAAEAEAEAAQRDIEFAASVGDSKAQAEAYRKLSRAEAKILNLENGKEALEREAKERPKQEAQPQAQADPLDNINLPPLAKDWLRNHREFLYDARKNAKIQTLHWDVVDEGHEAYSPSYFEVLEQKLGLRAAPKQVQEEDDYVEEPTQRRASVSAPPSREVPSSSGVRTNDRVVLTQAEKEAAKISGISEKEYAAQKLNLMKAKREGHYGGGQ